MDTTLRDGEQTSGVSFNAREKLSIARLLLEELRVSRIEIASARVSQGEQEAVRRIESGRYDVMILNFANCDMVGHTGSMDAVLVAMGALDLCVARIAEAVRKAGGVLVISADHGNADNAVNADGTPNTAHSLNPVPIVVVSDRVKSVHDGILADVAPTVLKLMGLEQPAEMTGKALVEMK